MGNQIRNTMQALVVSAALIALPIATSNVLPNRSLISLSETGTSAQAGSGLAGDESKMMLPNPFTYNYVAANSLSDEPGSAQVYRLNLNLLGSPQSILERVAEVMGLSGKVTRAEYSSEEYPAFVLGNQDGAHASASINWSGTGNWWYTNPAAWNNPMPVCDGGTDAEGNEICRSPEPTPELLPTKDEMIIEAMRVFNATGLKVVESDIHSTLNEWGASAYASMKIGGQESPIEWQISWSSNGEIGQVSGHTATAQAMGTYETISAKQAVSRLGDWRYSGAVAQSVWDKYQPADGGRVIAYDDAVAPEPLPSPSTITVLVNQAVETQMMIWDKSGTVWIVPGYLLLAEDGWPTPVFSLQDGIVQLPEPIEISPMVK